MDESFSQSATRHLEDAQILHREKRFDNAIYHAGYVVECSFKILVEIYIEDRDAARNYNHAIEQLEGEAMRRLRVLFPEIDLRLPTSRTSGTVICDDHPHRRYGITGRWTEAQSKAAVDRAQQIHDEIIPALILDGII